MQESNKVTVTLEGFGSYTIESGTPEQFYPALPGAVYEALPANDARLGDVIYLDADGGVVEAGSYVDPAIASEIGPKLVKAFKGD